MKKTSIIISLLASGMGCYADFYPTNLKVNISWTKERSSYKSPL